MVKHERKAAVALRTSRERLDAGGDNLGADAVSGNGGDAVGGHWRLLKPRG
jgi:hypothetical protein